MRSHVLAVLIALICFVTFSGDAQAAVIFIDFEDLGVGVGTQLNTAAGVSQDSGGFTFTPGPDNSSGLNDLHFHNQDGFGDNGSTNLGTHDDVVMTMVGGGAFDLLRFQFNGYIEEQEGTDVVAELSGGGSVLLPFSLNSIASPERGTGPAEPYDSFGGNPLPVMNVVSITWMVDDAFGANGFFLDNIMVNVRGGDAPEPGTLSVLGLGLLALVGYRRKRV